MLLYGYSQDRRLDLGDRVGNEAVRLMMTFAGG
jgi:hypothetical protein